jgi:hypothetical protein
MKSDALKLMELADAATLKSADRKFRNHLGGSQIGRECRREIWYDFRWAAHSDFSPRMLRLFSRGQREEARFVQILRSTGVIVQDHSQRLILHTKENRYFFQDWNDPVSKEWLDVSNDENHLQIATLYGVKPEQWRIKDIDGHFGGSLDGIAFSFPEMEEKARGLLEFKTHNTKSFVNLGLQGVKIAKPEHYKQMQIYMHKKELSFGLYGAVNKNDDDLYWEYVPYDKTTALASLEKARIIIYSKKPPDRISNSPAWFSCKYCSKKGVCHEGKPMVKNCRTCDKSTPVANGVWSCSHWNNIIPESFLRIGCDHYKQITD